MQRLARQSPFVLVLAGAALASVAALAWPGALAWAGEEPGQAATVPPRVTAVTVEAPPVVDGILDDACWRVATHIDGFWREQVDAPELERTEAWICYDARALYVAFRCHDSMPSEIRADQTKRQGSLGNDDRVAVMLDVEDGGRSTYQFRANPVGTQQDQVPGGTSEKIEWRGDWRAGARIDEGGWTAEVSIPFSFLRYPQGQDCFGIRLERRLGRASDDSIWPRSFARRQDPSECALLTQIKTPPVPFRQVVMPYLLSVMSENEEDREAISAGVDYKGTFPNGVVGLATYGPDFRNLEDVVETIDFTFVERYLPEYRPFFQEGSGYMPQSEGPVGLFYSRRVEELDMGAKAFGTVGRHRFGVLDAYQRGGENHLVWDYQHLFGTEGSLGFAGVQRKVPGEPDNQAYSLGTRWEYPFAGGSRSFVADWYRSRTEGEGGEGEAVYLQSSVWRRQGLGGWLGYSSVDTEFRADDGYVPDPGAQSLSGGVSYGQSYDEGALEEFEWQMEFEAGESDQGPRRRLGLEHDREWRSGWGVRASAHRGERDGYDVVSNQLSIEWNRRDMYRQGELDWSWGERLGDPYRYYALTQGFQPAENMSAQLSVERAFAAYYDDDGNLVPAEWSRQLVLSASYDISEEKMVGGRLVRSASSTNYYAAYRQRARRGMDLLVVIGDPNAERWVTRIAVKAIWCL